MASTNKTTNYELSQFEGTDKPSWEADYNADMLAIDTNLKSVSDVADGASGSISTLADRVTTAEGNITTNANDIDALEARADALEAGQTSDDSRLDAIEAEQIVQNTAIEGNTQLGYNIARPYDSASTYSLDDYALFQNTLYKCTTAVTTGEAFDPTKWTAIKVMDEVGGDTHQIIQLNANNVSNYFSVLNGSFLTDIASRTTGYISIDGNKVTLNFSTIIDTEALSGTYAPTLIIEDNSLYRSADYSSWLPNIGMSYIQTPTDKIAGGVDYAKQNSGNTDYLICSPRLQMTGSSIRLTICIFGEYLI